MWQKKTIKINKEGSKRTEGRGEKQKPDKNKNSSKTEQNKKTSGKIYEKVKVRKNIIKTIIK